jgi:glucose dehydrogenase
MRLSPSLVPLLLLVARAAAQSPADWPLHGHDLGGQRFSPLTAIDTGNVRRLVPQWT